MQLRSIQSKILLSFGLVVFMVIAAISFTFYYTISSTLTRDIRTQQLHTFIEASQSNLRTEFEKAIETSVALASDPTLVKWFEDNEVNDSLKNLSLNKIDGLVNEFGYLTSFAVSNKTRNFWSHNHQLLDVISKDDPDDAWFFQTVSNHQRIQSNLDFNRELNTSALFINVLMGDTSSPLGVAGVGINIDLLVEELTKRKFSQSSYICIVDNKGIIKLSQSQEHINQPLADIIDKNAATSILNNKQGLLSEYDINNEVFEVAHMNIGNTGHKTVLLVPTEELVSMLRPIRNYSLIIGFIFLIMALTLAYFISRSLAHPILKLNVVANALSQGDLSIDMEESLLTRKDEIGKLAFTFSQMTTKISEVIIQAKHTANSISKGGSLLSDSANELSSRSMQQVLLF